MRQNTILVLLAVTVLASGCTGQNQSPVPSNEPTVSSPSPPLPRPSPSLPDTDGPSVAPVDPPYTRATLRFVQVDAVDGIDQVGFGFTGKPKCIVTRLATRPAGGMSVRGNAFLQVTCSPADGIRTLPSGDSSQILPGERAAVAGRAWNPNTVNVIEAVQTSDGPDVLVWTIGLRHRAPWGVGAIGDNPIIGIQQ